MLSPANRSAALLGLLSGALVGCRLRLCSWHRQKLLAPGRRRRGAREGGPAGGIAAGCLAVFHPSPGGGEEAAYVRCWPTTRWSLRRRWSRC
jgi:hypothetical protein